MKKKLLKLTIPKEIKGIFLVVVIMLFVTSCSSNNDISKNKDNETNTNETISKDVDSTENFKKDDKTDFDAIVKDIILEYKNNEKYPMIEDFTISMFSEDLTINIIVNDDTDKTEAKELASSVLNSFGSSASNYNSRYIEPSKTSFGSVFKEIETHIGVAPLSKVDSKKEWLLNKVIFFTDNTDSLN